MRKEIQSLLDQATEELKSTIIKVENGEEKEETVDWWTCRIQTLEEVLSLTCEEEEIEEERVQVVSK